MTYWNPRLLPLWTGLLWLLVSGLALAESTPPIPVAELGARAEAQSPTPAPVLTDGRATLTAPLQALRGELDALGLSVESTSESEGGGRFRLTPTRLDKGGPAVELPAGRVSLREQTAVLERGPLTELLTASGDGLRQDFVVERPPHGDSPLRLTLAVEGAMASPAPAGVTLTLPDGRRLIYAGLHITDADGQVLEGALTATDERTLTIAVTDAGARYPLTIDPTISDSDWRVLNPGIPGANNGVRAVAYDRANNRLYVGGRFTAIGTVLANRIAQWDGSTWSALSSGLGGDDAGVYALAVSGSDLYAGGDFTSASGIPANHIARWDGSTWSALGGGLRAGIGYVRVSALAVFGSDLYVGGNFRIAGDVAVNHIARWNGSTWSALGSGVNGLVSALAVSGSDLYAGGDFTSASGVPANHIACWNSSTWSPLSGGLNGRVRALAVSSSDLYVGGDFTSAAGAPANRIAKWNGSIWETLGSGLGTGIGDEYVSALAVSGRDLYASGYFTSAGGVPANSIAKWNGSTWETLGSGLKGSVAALAMSGSDLYVGGGFTSAGGVPANRIAKWNGSNWSALGSGLDGDYLTQVRTLAISDNNLYVGGWFTTAGGNPAQNIARWDGSTWSALGSGMNNSVGALAVSGSDLYVGGDFTSAGGIPANRIAKWNGSNWSALGSGLDGGVGALAVSGDRLYVGGSFLNAGGQFSPYAAYVNLGTESFCWPCLPSQGGWRSTLP